MLARGGPKLLIFLAISAVFIVVQNVVGIAAAMAMDLHPVVGLLGGSITLTGGHGTGAAYGGRFGETMNIAGAIGIDHGVRDRWPGARQRPGRAAR